MIGEVLAYMLSIGLVAGYREADENLYLYSPSHTLKSSHTLAQALAGFGIGGQVIPTTSGATWQYSRKKTVYLLKEGYVDEVLAAKRAVYDLTGERLTPWSVPALARHLLKHLGLKQERSNAGERFRPPTHHYLYCKPTTSKEEHFLWDIKGCYWHLFSELETPYWIASFNGEPIPIEPAKEEMRAFERLKEGIAECKPLRNTFVGVCLGSAYRKQPRVSYALDKETGEVKKIKLPMTQGALEPAAQLVIRRAYELAQQARIDTRAVYSNTDCVITRENTPPHAWVRNGVKIDLKARGEIDVWAVGNYKVGAHETEPYQHGHRLPERCNSKLVRIAYTR